MRKSFIDWAAIEDQYAQSSASAGLDGLARYVRVSLACLHAMEERLEPGARHLLSLYVEHEGSIPKELLNTTLEAVWREVRRAPERSAANVRGRCAIGLVTGESGDDLIELLGHLHDSIQCAEPQFMIEFKRLIDANFPPNRIECSPG